MVFFLKFVFILYLKIVLTWKIVEVSKASVLYIYIYIDYQEPYGYGLVALQGFLHAKNLDSNPSPL